MAKKQGAPDGRLEEAIAILIQNQASFLARMAETDRRMSETDRENAERFARIEAILLEHSRILAEHTRLLESLPDTIRKKIGFQVPVE